MKRRVACCLLALNFALGCAPVQRQPSSPPNPAEAQPSAPTSAASAKAPARFSELPERHLVEEPSGARQKSVPT
ncbi:MAG: hypothetical protein KC492_29515, partial [Myxococcales bacterium]|nr:hypothetical protein [Myxococcales bacterium]